jgi:ferric-dicitrate binding protein FerR (iron transport regulator)
MNTEIEKDGIELFRDEKRQGATNGVDAEVMELMRTVGSRDVSDDVGESADRVFDRVLRRIAADETTPSRRVPQLRVVLRFAAAACLMFAAVAAAWLVGRGSGEKIAAEVPVDIAAPLGALASFVLADGTSVTLNGGSRIAFPSSFGSERRVKLSGEAFFDVAKDAERPFVVGAEHVAVKVLGTRFAVKCYEGDTLTAVTVEEGAVEASLPSSGVAGGSSGVAGGSSDVAGGSSDGTVEKLILRADRRLLLNNRTGEFSLSKVDAGIYTAWKDGRLYFDNITLDEIARIVERRFNARIEILDAELASERYFASFRHGETVDGILEILARKHSWVVVRRDDAIEIRRK